MDNDIWWAWNWTTAVTSHVEMGSQGIEYLARVRKVRLQSVHICRRIWKHDKVKIQDLMSLGEKIRNHMAASFTTASCKDLMFCQHKFIEDTWELYNFLASC